MKAIVNEYRKSKVIKPTVEIRNSYGNRGDDEEILTKSVPRAVKINAINKYLLTGPVFTPSTPKVAPTVKQNTQLATLIPKAKTKAKATNLKPAKGVTSVFGKLNPKKDRSI